MLGEQRNDALNNIGIERCSNILNDDQYLISSAVPQIPTGLVYHVACVAHDLVNQLASLLGDTGISSQRAAYRWNIDPGDTGNISHFRLFPCRPFLGNQLRINDWCCVCASLFLQENQLLNPFRNRIGSYERYLCQSAVWTTLIMYVTIY